MTPGADISSEPSMSATVVARSSTAMVNTVPLTTETRYGVCTASG